MSGRITPLSLVSQIVTLLAVVLSAQAAQAHRLDAQVFLLPNHQIQVESWFSNGDAAKGARVEVFGTRGQRIAEGQLNEQGVFVFTCENAEPIQVVISAGAGHRKELSISASALDQSHATPAKENEAPIQAPHGSSAPVPLAERNASPPIKDVLIGVGFLLALAAFVLSLRNARKLRALAQGKRSDN
jgi:nickel transport protein